MNTELKQYAQSFEQEILAYRDLCPDEFIQQFMNEGIYGSDDERYAVISEYFESLEVQHYSNCAFSYFEICLGCGGPNVYLNVNTRWESVEYVICWGGDSYSINLSYLYETICDIYALELHC